MPTPPRSRRVGARRFHPGPSLTAEEAAQAKASPSSIRGFAYVAVPEKVGETGVRAFCGDDRGVFCFTRTGVMPEIKDGRCPAACEIIQ
jgi:hypothetical protein